MTYAPPAPPITAPPQPALPWWKSKQFRLALAAFMFLAAVLVFFLGRTGSAGAGEIFTQPADTAGPNTFTPSVAAPPTTPAPGAITAPSPSSNGLVQANADAAGLYGGTRNVPSCNAGQLATYLEGNPTKGRAWAQAMGIQQCQIRPFINTLTPALLRVDTRVTDYQFGSRGNPLPRQSVMQANTAVLLDRTAFPRVRCISGDPVGQPRAVGSSPSYTGPRWAGFSPNTIVVIRPAPRPIPLVLIDFGNGATFVRIPGSIVIIDIDRPATGVTIVIVEPGGVFAVTGTRFPPGSALTVVFDNPPVVLGNPTADGAGNFAIQVTAPAGAIPGVHQVTTTGGGVSLTQPAYVIPPAPR